jgi:hypothetical protein
MHPWAWMVAGLTAAAGACLWARGAGADAVPLDILQVGLLTLGMLAAAIAVWMRCAARHLPSLDDLAPVPRRRAIYALVAGHALLAVGVSAWLIAKISDDHRLPGEFGGLAILWLLTAPWCAYSAYRMAAAAGEGTPLGNRLETAVLVTQGGIASMLGSWALYWGPDYADAWDSLRLFLAVVAAVALLAAPLVAASDRVRRLGVSVLVVLHFAAILGAVVSAPPGPYFVGVVQQYLFRPYTDFMYLNNAYRFYAPDPNAASQIWARIEYEYHVGKDKMVRSRWVKVPDMDEAGHHKYLTSVQYTRRLALSEAVARADPMPSVVEIDGKGKQTVAKYIKARDLHTPEPQYQGGGPGVLGVKLQPTSAIVPMDPSAPNYQKPSAVGRRLLSSFARHLLRQPYPDASFADARPVSVKFYRVQHRILSADQMVQGADPRDWIFYMPYYVGKFDAAGTLLDPDDPFLYWLLPIVQANPRDPRSDRLCYVYKHAGDNDYFVRPAPAKW